MSPLVERSGNQGPSTSDLYDVDCSQWREALCAKEHGAAAVIDERLVAAHLSRCADCQLHREVLRSSGTAAASHASAGTNDFHSSSRFHAATNRIAHWSIQRIVLGVVAIQVIAFALPPLLLGEEQQTTTHPARHLGSFGVAYGVALLVVAIRPARARNILPVAAVLAGAQMMAATVDLINGRIPLVREASHLPQIISVFLIWSLAVAATRRTVRTFE